MKTGEWSSDQRSRSTSRNPRRNGLSNAARETWRQKLSKAARAQNIVQPTVSKAIAALEERLGAQLLHRTSRGLSLSEWGLVPAEGEGTVKLKSVDRKQRTAATTEKDLFAALGLNFIPPELREGAGAAQTQVLLNFHSALIASG